MDITVIIPARMEATRFPGKPLAPILGKPMIQWVVESARRADVARVLVATDSERIAEAVRGFGGEAVMTRADHENGTGRIAEAAAQLQTDIVVNVQGDEPAIDSRAIDAVAAPLTTDQELPMATLAEEITNREEVFNPNIVKVVRDERGRALYFSRAPIPYYKRPGMDRPLWDGEPEDFTYLRHVGIYAYRRDYLTRYAELPTCPLERIEGLEQLRALYNGDPIQVELSTFGGIGVDTPEDVPRAEALLKARGIS